MTPRPVLLLVAGMLLTVVPVSPAAEDDPPIVVCEDADGNLVYQTGPCPKVVRKRVPPAPTPPSPPKRTPARVAPVQRVPPPPRARKSSRTTLTVVPPMRESRPAARFGAQRFPTRLSSTAPQTPPGFDSPQDTWRTFLVALETGDAHLAAACLTPSALDALPDRAETFPVDAMMSMVRSFVRIEDEGDLGVFWSAYGVRDGQRPKWIFFERTAVGEWKIAGI